MNDPGASLWSELAAIAPASDFGNSTELAQRGDHDAPVIIVIDGLVRLEDTDSRGVRVLTGIRGRGEMALDTAALRLAPTTHAVRGLVSGRAALLPRADFHSWLRDSPGAARRLAQVLAERLDDDHPPPMSDRTRVEVRLADRIVRLDERLAGRNTIDGELRVSLTHDDLASWIGATRAVTTRAMGGLRDRGLIDHGRGWIRVLDPEGLRMLQRSG